MAKVLLLFILIPALELGLLIEVGRHIGTLATLALIAVTGALGAFLARSQGLGVLRHMRAEVAAGRLPAASVVDGVIILLAGAVLITPGFLTDLVGFLCLVPALRGMLKRMLWEQLKRSIQKGRVNVFVHVEENGRSTAYDPYDNGVPPEHGPKSSLPKPRS